MTFHQRIKDLREDSDLSQKELAEILQTTQQYYGQYELGKRIPPITVLVKLCKYYNVSADYLLGFTDIKKELPK